VNFLVHKGQQSQNTLKISFPNGVDKLPHWGYILFMNKNNKLITVVETPEFIKQASQFMSDENRREFINYIAANPDAGDLITGTGGVRKVRWASDPSKGKSGGSRVIYFYHNNDMPLFLFTAYSKATRENISQSERNELKIVVKHLVDIYRSEK
jgi:hypothetical protein